MSKTERGRGTSAAPAAQPKPKMPLLDKIRRKSRPAVHSGLLGSDSGSSAPTETAAPPPPVRADSPPPSENQPSGPASTDSYLRLGDHVRALVREATRKKLKDVDHEASTRVLNFVKHNQCPIVLEEMAKVLCEKLSSPFANKQWLAVKLVHRLFSADAENFDGTKEMVVQEVLKVYRKHEHQYQNMSYKCRIEASRLIQIMTGEMPASHSNAHVLTGQALFGPEGILPSSLQGAFLTHAAGQPGALDGGGAQAFHIPSNGNEEIVHTAAQPRHQGGSATLVDPGALKREVLEKSGMVTQHADVLQDLLCNFTSDSSELGEMNDTLEMLGDLAQQSKSLLSAINNLILRCQQHMDFPGIAQAIEESTLGMDKLRDALDLYEDVKHTKAMDSSVRSEAAATGSAGGDNQPPPMDTPVDGVPVSFGHDPTQTRAQPPARTPAPPPTSAPQSTSRVDTNPFRRLTHTGEDGGTDHDGTRATRTSQCSVMKEPQALSGTNAPLIDLLSGTGEPSSSSAGGQDTEEPRSKEMEQLTCLFDESMDLLSGSGASGDDRGRPMDPTTK